MTEKRCTDCKHTKGIGYDFWCGEGHTEYEVFIGETNCPYFEYHDWSKGTPSEAEKRFYYAHGVVWDTKKSNGLNGIPINDLDNGLRVVNWLNELNDKNKKLKSENQSLKVMWSD